MGMLVKKYCDNNIKYSVENPFSLQFFLKTNNSILQHCDLVSI